MAKVAVILAGCGVNDGSEIHEAVFALNALDRAGAEVTMTAPDMELDVIDHFAGTPGGGTRNVFTESARIARGNIKPLAGLKAADFDALVLPGGFGAAKHLCDFAARGAEAEVLPEVASLVGDMHAAGKPIGAMCIAPVVLAATFRDAGFSPKLTIGNCPDTSAALEKMGATHVECAVDDVVVDTEHRLVSTPAYMLAMRIGELQEGIDKLVAEVLKLAEA